MKKLALAFSCAFLLGGLSVGSASADVFNWNLVGTVRTGATTPIDVGSGTFTANPNGNSGQYTITNVSGTLNGFAITGLSTVPFPTGTALLPLTPSDNILYFPATIPAIDPGQALFGMTSFLDTTGVSFVSNGQNYNLYYGSDAGVPTAATTGYNILFPDQAGNDLLTTFNLTPAAATAPTPEPGSLILLGTGVTGLAGVLRRRFVRA